MRTARCRSTSWVVFGLVALVVTCGCERQDERNGRTSTPAPPRVAPAIASGVVEPGVMFTIAMSSSVDSETSSVGDPVMARAETPLLAAEGTVVVPRGAPLRGRVSRVQRDATPVLAIDFETIDTRSGPAPVALKLSAAQQLTILDANERYDPDRSRDMDALFYAPGAVSPAGYVSPPPYVGQYDFYDAAARAIRVPEGATLRVVLTEPIVTPMAQ